MYDDGNIDVCCAILGTFLYIKFSLKNLVPLLHAPP